MNDHAEPFDCMVRTIFCQLHPDVAWDQQTPEEQRKWAVAVAKGHEVYWQERELHARNYM